MNKKEISGPRGTEALALILVKFGEGEQNPLGNNKPLEQDALGQLRSTGERVQSQSPQPLEVSHVGTIHETSPGQTNREKGQEPTIGSPIHPGWLVVYRGKDGRLRGGCDDRSHGTVAKGTWRGSGWTFTLTDGTVLPAKAIVSVGKTTRNGQVISAWVVRPHGLDGDRKYFP